MKYHKSLMIQRAIVNVVDSGMELLTCSKEIQLKDNIHDFLFSHCKKIMNDEKSIKGRFKRESVLVDPVMDAFKDKISFIELAAILSENLQESIQQHYKSGLFVVIEILVDMEKAYAMLFMEYQEAVIHKINYEEDKTFLVDLQTQTTMLPQKGKKIKRTAFVFSDGELLMSEPKEKDENGEIISFWVNNFLNARKVVGPEEHTRILYNSMEGWLRKNIKENVKAAINKREYLQLQYLDQLEITPEEVVKEIIEDTAEVERMLLALQGIGLMTDRPFQLDKKWIDKKLKTKIISTNVGIELKGSIDIFDDTSRYEINHNEDGTVNMLIKGIRNIQYK